MSVRRLHSEQPDSFAFTAENEAWAQKRIALYPEGREQSAVIPLMMRAQEQQGWVTKPAIEMIAKRLDMPLIRVLEVATFYTQFQLQPVGSKAHIQVCGTTPCMLRGSEEIIKLCKKRIAAHPHELSQDGAFSWEEVECLGACVNAPMVAVASGTYEDLTSESFEAVLDAFDRGETPKPGPQNGRTYCCPEGGQTSLTDPALYDGSANARWADKVAVDDAVAADKAEIVEEAAAKEAAIAAPADGETVSPYTWSAFTDGSTITMTGHLPDDATARHISRAAELASGRDFVDESTRAAGVADGVDMGAAGAYGVRMLAEMDEGRIDIVDDAFSVSGTPRGGEPATELYAVLAIPLGGVSVASVDLAGGEQEAVRNLADAAPGERPAWFDALPTLETLETVERDAAEQDLSAADQAGDGDEDAQMASALDALPKNASNEDKANAVGSRPAGLTAPESEGADDLKRIKGIGKVNEKKLGDLGIFYFHQIAAWTRPEIRWIGTFLAFPGRIDRDDWIGQAKVLAAGGVTKFAGRVDSGDVPSSQD